MNQNYLKKGALFRPNIWLKRVLNFTFIVAFLTVTIAATQAQNRTVSGKVTDSSGEGLIGVNILEKGTLNGAVTDIDGNYTISVQENATLVFTYIGFGTQEIAVGSLTTVDLTMEEDYGELDEVVVIGYGSTKKSDLTGAVSSISEKDFNQGALASPQDLLVGRIPGVSVISDNGAPGTGSTIRIRGGSSLSASNNPLFVIDGVVLSDEGISGTRNPLSTINPSDIETFTVLKDASATAIYGARASNGVILITTKRGKAGQKMTLNYDGQFSVSTLPKKVDVLSGDEYRDFVAQGIIDGNIPAAAGPLLGAENTDWQDQVFRDAFTMNHNVSLAGSLQDVGPLKNLPYRASIGYMDQEGTLKGTEFQRVSASLNLDPSFLNDDLKVQLSAKYSSSTNQFTNEGAIGSSVTFDPTQPVRDTDSPWGGYFYWPQTADPNIPITIAPSNPAALIDLTNNEATANRFIGNMKATYNLPFVDGLSATLNAAIDRTNSDGLEIVSEQASWERDVINSVVALGRRNKYDGETKNDLLEFYVNYTRDIESINSNLSFTAGLSEQYFFRESSSVATKLNTGDTTTVFDPASSENILKSYFGRLNFTMNEKYLFTFTLRRDGSSRFGSDNQWGLFPSAAFAWRVKDESFLTNFEPISDLKFRAGYGVTGQENVGPVYPALARVNIGDDLVQYAFGQGTFVNIARFEAYDANLKWEETTTINAGVDFGFWNNRISGSFDWYKRETNDLLNVIPVPRGTNFANELLTNVGSLEINGLEFAMNAIIVDNSDVRFDVGFNISKVTNEITKLTNVEDPNYQGVSGGGISGGVGSNIQISSVGFSRNQFFLYQQVYDQNGNPVEGLYVDQNGDGIINDDDRVRYKSPDPTTFMGFNSNVSYKQFSLGFNARLNLGNYNYNNVNSQYAYYNGVYNTIGYTNNTNRNLLSTNFSDQQLFSDYYLSNASFFRMDNITASYRIDKLVTERVAGTLSFTVQNAFVITDYEGLDPEIGNGIDNNLYPRPRVFVLGLNLNFK